MADKPPVFIIGSPRSGTTVLRLILNRHPSLAICGETRFFADIYKRRRVFGSLEDIKNRRRLVEQYLSTARIRRLGVDLQGLKEQLLREATSYPALFTGILRYYAASQGKKRFGEKTPHHAFYADTLCAWYPGAAIIHLVRDPRDVVASLQRTRWAPDSILNNTSMWLLFNRAARRLQNYRGYLLVHYETLVTQPEQELARICAHLEEECAPATLLAAEPVDGPYSFPRHASGPLTTERLHKWQEQLTAQEVSLIEWVAARDMQTYGYSRSAGSVSIAAVARGLAAAALDPLRRQLEQSPYTWCRLTQPTNLAAQEYWKYRNVWDTVFPGLRAKE
ncbi:MAG: sulfotransferase [Acidobacteriia bacterium]|nr:sulfotransferase [Terriglobia bacterium]